MYGEQLNEGPGNGGYGDDAAAPAAFQIQDYQYSYENDINKQRGGSQVESYTNSQRAGNGGYDDAVYIGDDDANSVDGNSFGNKPPHVNVGGHDYYRSASVRGVESPRDQWAASAKSPDPTKGVLKRFKIWIFIYFWCFKMYKIPIFD